MSLHFSKKPLLLYLAFFLLLLTATVFYLDYKSSHRELTFAMLDVGQGDAIFIESPSGTQILVDGGPPRKILGTLARVMPAYDKEIDAILITNPDADHIGGFFGTSKKSPLLSATRLVNGNTYIFLS